VGLRHPVAKALVAAAQEHGLVINAPNDETIRLVPALTIGDVEIDEFVELFTASLRTVEDALVLEGSTHAATSTEVPA
jgi:acetylornithine/N-succinyldiaminopimelate aminotransferase